MTITITDKQHVDFPFRKRDCPCCGKPYGTRKVVMSKDIFDANMVVHSQCKNEWEQRVRDRKRERAREAEDAEQRRREKQREDNIARRGTDPQAFIEECFATNDRQSEDDRIMNTLLYRALGDLRSADAELEKFKQRLDEDPVYALEWSHSFFEKMAERKVALEIVEWFERGESGAEIKDELTKSALRGARSPGRSTSKTSNLVDECMTEAYAKHVYRY